MFHQNGIEIASLSKIDSWELKKIDHPQEFGSISFTFISHQNFIYAFPHSIDYFKKKEMTVYIFDTERFTWTKLRESGQVPLQRKDFTVVKYKDSFYLYGGYTKDKWSNDFYKFDIVNQKWEIIDGKGKRPLKRSCHSSCIYLDSMYIFGGGFDISIHNDLFRYDFKTNEWHIMKPKGDIPSGREKHLCGIIGNQMLTFGSYGVINNIVFIYQFDTNTWQKIECTVPYDFNAKLNEELIFHKDSLIGIQCFKIEKYNIYQFKITTE